MPWGCTYTCSYHLKHLLKDRGNGVIICLMDCIILSAASCNLRWNHLQFNRCEYRPPCWSWQGWSSSCGCRKRTQPGGCMDACYQVGEKCRELLDREVLLLFGRTSNENTFCNIPWTKSMLASLYCIIEMHNVIWISPSLLIKTNYDWHISAVMGVYTLDYWILLFQQ
jgi:hypothetical protein